MMYVQHTEIKLGSDQLTIVVQNHFDDSFLGHVWKYAPSSNSKVIIGHSLQAAHHIASTSEGAFREAALSVINSTSGVIDKIDHPDGSSLLEPKQIYRQLTAAGYTLPPMYGMEEVVDAGKTPFKP
ncbi:hypothetical protein FE236_04470 [Mariprofundus erugo]|uniref:hypothetical protein n=1 Tax=Mariprofundus erugo TaxID=2528639 RepID=UPI0010FDCCD9|nr:hypothetical protein [Mariprofundus erugo]TLS77051.1 hypothetical protein FE236_04470 [Mariprofundus erugo]